MGHLSAPRFFAWSALEDQQCAAALMWVSVTILLLAPAVVVTMQLLAPQDTRVPREPFTGLHGIAGQTLKSSTHEVS